MAKLFRVRQVSYAWMTILLVLVLAIVWLFFRKVRIIGDCWGFWLLWDLLLTS